MAIRCSGMGSSTAGANQARRPAPTASVTGLPVGSGVGRGGTMRTALSLCPFPPAPDSSWLTCPQPPGTAVGFAVYFKVYLGLMSFDWLFATQRGDEPRSAPIVPLELLNWGVVAHAGRKGAQGPIGTGCGRTVRRGWHGGTWELSAGAQATPIHLLVRCFLMRHSVCGSVNDFSSG
jgi:hypothetical protein